MLTTNNSLTTFAVCSYVDRNAPVGAELPRQPALGRPARGQARQRGALFGERAVGVCHVSKSSDARKARGGGRAERRALERAAQREKVLHRERVADEHQLCSS